MHILTRTKHFITRTMNIQKMVISILRGLLIIGCAFLILWPIIIKIPSSIMTQADIYDLSVKWIPRTVTMDNYIRVFEHFFPAPFFNSMLLSFVVSLLQLASCTLIGYGFGRYNFKGNKFFLCLVILTLIIPPQLNMISLYLNFRYFDLYGLIPQPLNLLGTFWPFILMGITGTGLRNGLFILIMRQFFQGMPRALEEAAHVDGAGPLKTFFKVMLPGAIPAMVVVFLFSFVWQWNDYYMISMYMRDAELLPHVLGDIVPLVMRSMDTLPPGTIEAGGITDPYASLIRNTGMLMFMVPLLIIYGFMQRHFIESAQRTGLVE